MDELANLAPEDIFRLAIMRSNFPVPILARRLGWTESFLRRVTSSEKYFPSFVDIPAFCAAVGNTLVIEWQLARVRLEKKNAPATTPAFLRDQVLILTNDLGDVASKIRAVAKDNRITKTENRGILKEVLELADTATALAGALRESDRKVVRNG